MEMTNNSWHISEKKYIHCIYYKIVTCLLNSWYAFEVLPVIKKIKKNTFWGKSL